MTAIMQMLATLLVGIMNATKAAQEINSFLGKLKAEGRDPTDDELDGFRKRSHDALEELKTKV